MRWNLTDPCLEWVNATIPSNEFIDSATLAGVLCVPSGFTFVCSGYYSPWAYECLDGWHITGQYLLGNLTVPLTVHRLTQLMGHLS